MFEKYIKDHKSCDGFNPVPDTVNWLWPESFERSIRIQRLKKNFFNLSSLWGRKKLNKPSPWGVGAQIGNVQSAPLKVSTPFLSIPYHKIGSIEEWCRYFWDNIPKNVRKREKRKLQVQVGHLW